MGLPKVILFFLTFIVLSIYVFASGADTNSDGCVDLSEIVVYVELWQGGQISLGDVVGGVEQWQQGCS